MQQQNRNDDNPPKFGGPIGLIVFAILVGASIYRATLGIQLAGVAEIWLGFSFVRAGKVPYGWRGQPTSGYITGPAAVIMGLAVVALGIYMLARPEAVVAWGHRH